MTSERRPATDRTAAKLARLQEMLKDAKRAERDARGRQAQIVGEAVIAEFGLSKEFHRHVAQMLRRSVTSPVDRAEIAPLLIELPP
jgi:hypothetical protein